jgi:hypothetical protein
MYFVPSAGSGKVAEIDFIIVKLVGLQLHPYSQIYHLVLWWLIFA